jgi:microsomal dipeptidase-like Zn-dependent dipeptidase
VHQDYFQEQRRWDTMYPIFFALENNPDAHIVLVGDCNQLPSVSPGNFLSDITKAKCANVVKLDKIHRQDENSYISLIANEISNGKVVKEIPEGATDIKWQDATGDQLAAYIAYKMSNYLEKHNVEDIQLIAPMYKGVCGITKINEIMQTMMSKIEGTTDRTLKRPFQLFYAGDRVMQWENNYEKEVFNGDMGKIVDLGKEVIVEMNKWGIMLDVSHPSKESMRDMIELSKAPIIASHSSARALCNHSRNLDDEQLAWMKENGGVVQTVAFSSYVSKEKSDARSEALKDIQVQIADSLGVTWITSWSEYGKLSEDEKANFRANRKGVSTLASDKAKSIEGFPPAVGVTDFVDHIDYLIGKMGIEHVGISSDFDGGGGVEGWNDASETLNVTIELVRRGYSEEEIGKLWSGNLLRVLDEVGTVAEEIQAAS